MSNNYKDEQNQNNQCNPEQRHQITFVGRTAGFAQKGCKIRDAIIAACILGVGNK